MQLINATFDFWNVKNDLGKVSPLLNFWFSLFDYPFSKESHALQLNLAHFARKPKDSKPNSKYHPLSQKNITVWKIFYTKISLEFKLVLKISFTSGRCSVTGIQAKLSLWSNMKPLPPWLSRYSVIFVAKLSLNLLLQYCWQQHPYKRSPSFNMEPVAPVHIPTAANNTAVVTKRPKTTKKRRPKKDPNEPQKWVVK